MTVEEAVAAAAAGEALLLDEDADVGPFCRDLMRLSSRDSASGDISFVAEEEEPEKGETKNTIKVTFVQS